MRLATKTVNQGLVYGACWVVVYELGSCVDNIVRAGFGLRAVSLAVGMVSVFVVVACWWYCGVWFARWLSGRLWKGLFVGWLDCGEDDGEGCCEAGCKLDLMKGGADGCMRAYTADSGAH